MITEGLFTSNKDTWNTPRDLFDWLDRRFHFTLDPCCTHESALCEKHYTPEEDGLSQSWAGESVFMNPPYGREIPLWVEKAYRESLQGALVVGLVPSRTDTKWWHDYVADKASVLFLKGRVKFDGGGQLNSAPFPSAIIVWFGAEQKGYIGG